MEKNSRNILKKKNKLYIKELKKYMIFLDRYLYGKRISK